MFSHLHRNEVLPKRVVILGARGFVGSATVTRLVKEKIEVLALGREDLDLSQDNAANKLAAILQPDDALVIIAAEAPCKDYNQLLGNIQMAKSVCDALSQQTVSHVIYISSDAVYADSLDKLSEFSPTAPTSLHGIMHLAREKMLESIAAVNSLAILRPTLLYGPTDPHNGYGPNSFYRLAVMGKTIELFGQGEEQRDHVYIDDVAEIIYHCLLHRSYGILNITTGEVVSFYQVAEEVIQVVDNAIAIQCHPRTGPMPHNGYRAFDTMLCRQLFPEVKFRSLKKGLAEMHQSSGAKIAQAAVVG